jgi:hypothetical protein
MSALERGESRLDGNAIAGLMVEIFGREMTPAVGVCGSCRAEWRLAEVRVYGRAPGIVARCPRCEGVLLQIVETPDRIWVSLSGLAVLEIDR